MVKTVNHSLLCVCYMMKCRYVTLVLFSLCQSALSKIDSLSFYNVVFLSFFLYFHSNLHPRCFKNQPCNRFQLESGLPSLCLDSLQGHKQ